MSIEGVDYSRGGYPSPAELKAAGKSMVVRYVVGDLGPTGRGITATEYAELTAGGIEVAAVWEGAENRITSGFAAGQVDARDAQHNLVVAGMPNRMPIYLACDFDAAPEDQPAIDDYLRGAAAVLGLERIGIYGGRHVVKRCFENKTASLYWQTSAWSGGVWYEHNNLEQYAYGVWIGGVNCDLTRAVQDHYGQASDFINPPPPPPPVEPFPGFAHGLETGTDQHVGPQIYQYIDRVMTVRKGRQAPGYDKPGGTKLVTHHEGDKVRSAFIANLDGKQYVWDRDGTVYTRSPWTPKLTLQRLP